MIQLTDLDKGIIVFFFLLVLAIGFAVSKKSSQSSKEYFLSGRTLPWWLLGLSMVATTFSTDTPNLVTDIVRQNGVSGNWVWWIFLLTGLLTVFVYAKLWRRSNVNTDMEFYELRYSGWAGRFLRGFRSIYLGIIFNVLAMAGVTLAAIKIGAIMLDISALETVLYAGGVTLIFSSVGGFRGVVYTDFILFFTAMIGAVGAAYYLVNLPEVGGMSGILSNELVLSKVSILPDLSDEDTFMTLMVIPLAVQWWSAWYPGAEPGGGGYIAQRMLAAKSENHALGATLFFNIMHYALRPWPWILVALASLIIFPDLDSIRETFPNVVEDKIGHDLAYPAMLTLLPTGLLGFVLASLVSAYMSTISTHLNWGSSYVVNDFYKQLINKNASEKELVNVGRISVVILMIISSIFALALTNAYQLFDIILMFGAGTGSIFILRWFWWRINAWSEIAAMLSSGLISMLFANEKIASAIFNENFIEPYFKLPVIVLITTIVWLVVTFVTKPDDDQKLIEFYKKTRPGGPGWKRIVNLPDFKNEKGYNKTWAVPRGILCMLVGCLAIYSALFSTGYFIYGELYLGLILLSSTIIFSIILFNLSKTLFND
ncbi:MAG: Na+:solute symporter [Flavobacteriaceae bacterium]|nr:Na+:solute symporter [Flavobacteriaceae bacterium]|tara:strand:- start:1921 stop:3717 length:1797 start_codon:yes stop_codon:yes gene_type:complete